MNITTAVAECTIGNTTFEMSPLSVKQIEEIDNWMRVKFLRSIRDAAEGDQEMLAVGMAEMLKLSFFTARGSQFLSSMDGIAKLISVCSNVEYADALGLLKTDSDLASFNAAFKLLNGSEGKSKSGPDPQKPTT